MYQDVDMFSKACNLLTKRFNNREKRYKKLYRFGSGGLADVDCMFDTWLNRVDAVKKLKDRSKRDKHLVKAFITESRMMAFLNHPNIIPIYDISKDSHNNLRYTMKAIEGKSLCSIMDLNLSSNNHNQETITQYIDIFKTLCNTMAYVHDKGVIHLDLKPENIMIGLYGDVLIVDWGNASLYNKEPYHKYIKKFTNDIKLAKLDHEDQDIILGTPTYMSPEQTNTPRDMLTPASDIFSLGLILYKMLTGTHPFPVDQETGDIMKEVCNSSIEAPNHLRAETPKELSRICMKMLEKDVDKRYNNLNNVVKEINRFQASGSEFTVKTYQKGDIVFNEGDSGKYAFNILSGSVEVYKTIGGGKRVLAVLGQGNIVGELALLTDNPRSATVMALEDTKIQVLKEEKIKKELSKLNPWVENMITGLSSRFTQLSDKLANMQQNQ